MAIAATAQSRLALAPAFTPELFQCFLAYWEQLQVTVSVDRLTPIGALPRHVEPSEKFELPPPLPSLPLDDPQQPVHYTEEWAPIAAVVYRFGGRIIYRQVARGELEATMELPPLWRQSVTAAA